MSKIDDVYFDPESPIGQPQRHMHVGCGTGKDSCLIVTRDDMGWQFYCHRCGIKGYHPIKEVSPNKLLKFLKSRDNIYKRVEKVELPGDYTSEIAPAGLTWLLSYGLTQEEILKSSFGWSASMESIIMPVYTNDTLVYWQARYTGKLKTVPKYRSQRQIARKEVYFDCFKEYRSWGVVLVEDIISAVKVGRVVDARALLSKYISPIVIQNLTDLGYKSILVWLDHDMIDKAAAYVKRYSSFGYPVRIVDTPKDPKYYNEEEIQNAIILR